MLEKIKNMSGKKRRLLVFLFSLAVGCLNIPAMFKDQPGWFAVGVTAVVYLIWIVCLMTGLRDAKSKMGFCTLVNITVLVILAAMTAVWFIARESFGGQVLLKIITLVLGTPVIGLLRFWPGGLFDMICFAYVMLAVIIWLVKGMLYSERKEREKQHL